MDLPQLWERFLEGRMGGGAALALALLAVVIALVIAFAMLRPLVRLLSVKDPDKTRDSRLRRVSFALCVRPSL